MNSYVSFLRGINIGAQKRVKMEELEGVYESLGFDHVRSYIQSGNVIFGQDSDTNASILANKIERKLKRHFGFDVAVFIRTPNDLQTLIKNFPFKGRDDSKALVTFLYVQPVTTDFSIDEINQEKGRGEEFSISGKEIYLFCPNGYGRTKLSNTFFEKKLKVSATTRNWNTVSALFNLSKED